MKLSGSQEVNEKLQSFRESQDILKKYIFYLQDLESLFYVDFLIPFYFLVFSKREEKEMEEMEEVFN